MPEIITRAGKGSELSHNELDANFTRPVTQKTTTYQVLGSDNRSIIEGNHASTAFTITMPTVANAAAEDTGDFETTFTNINAAVVSIDGSGSETIDGSTGTIDLEQYESVTVQLDSAQTGWNTVSKVVVLKTKIIEIGDWDMDADQTSTPVAHGLTYANIRSVSALVRNDADDAMYDLSAIFDSSSAASKAILVQSTNITLQRPTGSYVDATTWNSTSYNRGWITINYV